MKMHPINLIFSLVGNVVGLECFDCVDGVSPALDTVACADLFNRTTTDSRVNRRPCPAGFDACAKAKASEGSLTLTARKCYMRSHCPVNEECASADFQGTQATICCCRENLCNEAGFPAANVIMSVTVFMAVAFTL
ncbi:uncharacterized protein LOC110977109 [Acanthaster planci]|uniref:Uncharacterized protein LOC110977109 n=1 Tax=Acanthaster planci TaxID=133434 RepID=A0A8B7Y2U1_ACAPL|nr:uncharacterized protein LOC110977109 [Acanthaster planci]